MAKDWKIIVVSADATTRRELSKAFSRLKAKITVSWLSTVEECKKIPKRASISMVFCDERVTDGYYWDICETIAHQSTKKPKIVLIARSMKRAEWEQARRSGTIFTLLQWPCRPAAVQWAITLAQRSFEPAESRGDKAKRRAPRA